MFHSKETFLGFAKHHRSACAQAILVTSKFHTHANNHYLALLASNYSRSWIYLSASVMFHSKETFLGFAKHHRSACAQAILVTSKFHTHANNHYLALLASNYSRSWIYLSASVMFHSKETFLGFAKHHRSACAQAILVTSKFHTHANNHYLALLASNYSRSWIYLSASVMFHSKETFLGFAKHHRSACAQAILVTSKFHTHANNHYLALLASNYSRSWIYLSASVMFHSKETFLGFAKHHRSACAQAILVTSKFHTHANNHYLALLASNYSRSWIYLSASVMFHSKETFLGFAKHHRSACAQAILVTSKFHTHANNHYLALLASNYSRSWIYLSASVMFHSKETFLGFAKHHRSACAQAILVTSKFHTHANNHYLALLASNYSRSWIYLSASVMFHSKETFLGFAKHHRSACAQAILVTSKFHTHANNHYLALLASNYSRSWIYLSASVMFHSKETFLGFAKHHRSACAQAILVTSKFHTHANNHYLALLASNYSRSWIYLSASVMFHSKETFLGFAKHHRSACAQAILVTSKFHTHANNHYLALLASNYSRSWIYLSASVMFHSKETFLGFAKHHRSACAQAILVTSKFHTHANNHYLALLASNYSRSWIYLSASVMFHSKETFLGFAKHHRSACAQAILVTSKFHTHANNHYLALLASNYSRSWIYLSASVMFHSKETFLGFAKHHRSACAQAILVTSKFHTHANNHYLALLASNYSRSWIYLSASVMFHSKETFLGFAKHHRSACAQAILVTSKFHTHANNHYLALLASNYSRSWIYLSASVMFHSKETFLGFAKHHRSACAQAILVTSKFHTHANNHYLALLASNYSRSWIYLSASVMFHSKETFLGFAKHHRSACAQAILVTSKFHTHANNHYLALLASNYSRSWIYLSASVMFHSKETFLGFAKHHRSACAQAILVTSKFHTHANNHYLALLASNYSRSWIYLSASVMFHSKETFLGFAKHHRSACAQAILVTSKFHTHANNHYLALLASNYSRSWIYLSASVMFHSKETFLGFAKHHRSACAQAILVTSKFHTHANNHYLALLASNYSRSWIYLSASVMFHSKETFLGCANHYRSACCTGYLS
ncbi:PREDICTED: uncharacterized protein LOC107355492 [Acropora digitifera]|uniref:uncharacterized protein LOC107355492 n=1 Tax=Acropora digitifera TaxID=70779 RepID=UPI00077AF1C2|nr:PREDICTED: uncharacterized protein LOC107355492 [Acropora digitifera]